MHQATKRGGGLLALATAALLVLGACGDDDDSQGGAIDDQRPTVALAFVGARTGENANLGINIYQGAKLAVDEANASGDLPVKLELKSFDTQGDPAQAQTLKDQIVPDDEIVGVIGPAFSGESNAANPTFENAGLATITPSASNPQLSQQGWKVFHRIIANDKVQAEQLAAYLSKGLKAASMSYVHDNTDYGKGLAELTRAEAEAAGIKTELFEAIDPKGTDYSAAVNKLKAKKSPVVFYGGYYNEAGRLVKQMRDASVTATFLSGDGTKDPGFVTSAGQSAAEGVEVTCACSDPTVATDALSKAFTSAYETKFGKAPGTYSAEGYDAVNLFVEAMRNGAATRAGILEYLNSDLGTFKGLTKDITFLPNGEIASGAVYVYRFEGGKLTVKGTTTELAK